MEKEAENLLSEGYKTEGKDFDMFKSEVGNMTDRTKTLTCMGADITFLSLCTIPDYQREGKKAFYVLSKDTIQRFLDGKKLQIGYVSAARVPGKLASELEAGTEMLLCVGKDFYILSEVAVRSLMNRSEVRGFTTAGRENLIRNLHVADAVTSRNEKLKLVYREAEQDGIAVKVCFALLSGEYAPLPQRILPDVLDKIEEEGSMGKVETDFWHISQDFTYFRGLFPETGEAFSKAYGLPDKLVPGITLETSDVGDSSFIIRGTLAGENSYVVTEELALRHVGTLTDEVAMRKADEKIFANIRKIPECLLRLFSIPLIDYGTNPVTAPAGRDANSAEYRRWIEELCDRKFFKNISIQKGKDLVDAVMAEVDPSVEYTLYDVAVKAMSLPGRLQGIDRYHLDEFRKRCGAFPMLMEKEHEKELKSRKKEEEEEVFLLPE